MIYYRLKDNSIPRINLINSVTIRPPYVHFRRQLDEYVIYIIVRGEMHLRENNIDYVLKQNDVMILSPQYEHYGIKATECEYYFIHFNCEIVEDSNVNNVKEDLLSLRFKSLKSDGLFGMREDNIILPNYFHFSSTTSVINLISKVGEIISLSKDRREHFSVKADCMLMELFIDMSRACTSELLFETKASSSKASRKVFDLLNYFNSYYMENISGDSIEEILGCNFDYLNRVFKQATGKTIFNYLNELRISKAKHLLESGFHSITDVAEMTGFNDAYYFSKVFKKYAGTTPGKYSKSKRQTENINT